MKLKSSMESYNIKSISEIEQTVVDVNNRCAQLEELGAFIKAKLASASQEFDSINYVRTEAAIDSYMKKLIVAQTELTELADSVKAFVEQKIKPLWS